MRIRCLALVAALVFSVQAKAQIGLYGTVTSDHFGGIKPPYPYTDSYGYWAVGGSFGIYDDFAHAGPIRLGADLRGNILNSNGHKLNSGLAGVRFVFNPEVIPLRPYAQASVGVGSTNYGTGSNMTTGFQYQILGGLDFTFFPRLDWRVVEIGGGGLHASGTNYPIGTVSTGIVFRLP
ncbi:hypothetical protein [Edaphobacter bradus]|uniref:hypothetical protein n=1 Tax=Edaphobacter bradus TaxID=2259016 RepID=UPI0021E04178|nr:hypothetical protein [Edaphobacter bradus]